MTKNFKFILDLTVDIKDEIEENGKKKNHDTDKLIKEFLKDDRAILDLYKLWLLGDLRTDEHYDCIEKKISVKKENDIIKPILRKCPRKTQKHFLEILQDENHPHFEDLENFFEHFDLLSFKNASFVEVG